MHIYNFYLGFYFLSWYICFIVLRQWDYSQGRYGLITQFKNVPYKLKTSLIIIMEMAN